MNNSGTERRNGGILWGREAKDTEFSGFLLEKVHKFENLRLPKRQKKYEKFTKSETEKYLALFVCM